MAAEQEYAAQSWSLMPVPEGESTITLVLPRGAQVRAAHLVVRGAAYVFSENLLAPQYGATVEPFEAADGGWLSAVVDFHGLRAASRLDIRANWAADENRWCRIQAWAGITWHQPEPAGSYCPQLQANGLQSYSFPEFEVQKLMLSFHTGLDPLPPGEWAMAATTVEELQIRCRSLPASLSLSIGDGPPLWTHHGPLAKALHTPDLAEAINDYLAGDSLAEGQVEHIVPLMIQSAALGLLEIALEDLSYYFVTDCFADDAAEMTLTFGCNEPWTQEAAFDLPPGMAIEKAVVHLAGEFAQDRFAPGLGPPACSTGTYAALVSEDQWLAQPLSPAGAQPLSPVGAQPLSPTGGLALSGIDLCLAPLAGEGAVTVEVQTDRDQAPSGAALASVEVTLGPTGDASAWYCPDLPETVDLEAGEAYWLVLKGSSGQAAWQATAGETDRPLCYSQDGGQTWAGYDLAPWEQPTMTGLFRLRHLPAEPELPITLDVGGVAIDLGSLGELGSEPVSINFQQSMVEAGAPPLRASATSRGQLTLSGLRVEYAPIAGNIPESLGPIDGQPVSIVDGVGQTYAERLAGAGIETVGDLAGIDPFLVDVGIPTIRLFEFKRKAQLALAVELDPEKLAAMGSLTLTQLLLTSPAELSRQTGLPLSEVSELRALLRTLQVTLDNAFLAQTTVGALSS